MEPIPAARFGKGHLGLIAVTILLLSTAMVMRGGFTLGAFGFSKAESASDTVTAEQLEAEAARTVAASYAAAQSQTDPNAMAAYEQKQMSELDPNYDSGAVLGDSTGSTTDINIEQLLSAQSLETVSVNSFTTNDPVQLNNYALQLHAIESNNNALGLLGVMTSRDAASLQTATVKFAGIIQQLQNMKVPVQFVTYHRYKLLYYSSLATMASSMTPNGPTTDAGAATQLFFSLGDKMDALSSQLLSQYGVAL